MDKDFLTKLKGTLQAIIEENKMLKAQVDALNHSVNDVIIGGLKDAALEYEDNENFSNFYDTYNEMCSPLGEDYKLLYGDDADIIEDLYDNSKNYDDVGSYVSEEIKALQEKLDKLRAIKNDSTVVTEESKEEESAEEPKEEDKAEVEEKSEDSEEEPIDEEELMKIAKTIR